MPVYQLRSEVPGTVWEIDAEVGAEVVAGAAIVIVESMKMEIPIITEKPGIVQQVLVATGDIVDENQVVAAIEASG